MKKITKSDLKGLAEMFPGLNIEQQKKIKGGEFVGYFQMSGGMVTNWTFDGFNFSVFIPNDGGRPLVLEGVHVGNNTLPYQYSNTACYYNGEIRVGEDWKDFGYSDLLHEYGHYLQEQAMGYVGYYWEALMSALDMLDGGEGHEDRPFERDATNRGNDYANDPRNNPDPTSY
jgi:hypothetical protein